MHRPLDELLTNRTGRVKAARLFSNIVSPPVMFSLLGLAISLWELPFWQGMAWAATYGFFVSLLPILFVLFMLRTGRISELHMSNTRERHLPYVIAIICAGVGLVLVSWLNGPPTLRCLLIFNIIELSLLAVVNIFWLISIHATGIMATMTIVWLVFGWAASLLVLPFVIAICWVRLYLKRHTPAQVGAGLLTGVLSVLSLTAVGCFQG